MLPIVLKIINACIAGFIGILLVFPLDLVKTRLQTQQPLPNGKMQYTSMIDCFKKTFKAEGFRGMYRGVGITVILLMPEKALKLVVNDFFREKFKTKEGTIPIPKQILAGCLAGCFQVTVTTPLELLKIQMQNAGRVAAVDGQPKKTTISVIKSIFEKYGVLGLYKGIRPTLARDVAFSAFYFPTFAFLNGFGPRRDDGSGEAASWVSFASGCAAAGTGSFLVTPIDVVKTRLQNLDKVKGETTYKGMGDAFTQILKREGVKALFRGGGCRVMVVTPLFGILQVVYLFGIAERIFGVKYYRMG